MSLQPLDAEQLIDWDGYLLYDGNQPFGFKLEERSQISGRCDFFFRGSLAKRAFALVRSELALPPPQDQDGATPLSPSCAFHHCIASIISSE